MGWYTRSTNPALALHIACTFDQSIHLSRNPPTRGRPGARRGLRRDQERDVLDGGPDQRVALRKRGHLDACVVGRPLAWAAVWVRACGGGAVLELQCVSHHLKCTYYASSAIRAIVRVTQKQLSYHYHCPLLHILLHGVFVLLARRAPTGSL